MKQIYIILTYSGTVLSKIIKTYTKDEFSHVSIALDENLNSMYSFGRLRPNNPFVGGFVHEGIHHGTFKKFVNTEAKVYSIPIDEKQYNKIKEAITIIKDCEVPYKFNIVGLFAVAFHKKIHMQHSFYCAEFVKYVLEQAQLNTHLPDLIRPEDFKGLQNIELKFSGKLKDYKANNKPIITIEQKMHD